MKMLVKLVVSVAFAGFMQTVRSEWTCSDSTLVWSEDGVEYWKLAVAVEGMSITLTSLQCNPQASGVLDLTGALEAYGITGTGYSLAFVEGEGLSVFSSVTDLAITGSWFSEMATQAGAVFT